MFQVNNPAYENLPNEKSVTVDSDGDRVHIHPWLSGINDRADSSVAVSLGEADSLSLDGTVVGDDWAIAIVNRSEFVEAVLAVFPELVRA